MLDRDPTRRYGCAGKHTPSGGDGEGYMEFQKHAWFQSIDWDALEKKILEPPFVPDVRRDAYLVV
jgi:serine/threonine kinase 32